MKLAGIVIVAVAVGLFVLLQFWGNQTLDEQLLSRLPLSRAAWEGNDRELAQLLSSRGDVNERDAERNTPLHRATDLAAQQHYPGGDHEACARRLIAAGADPAVLNRSGEAPLYRALWNPRFTELLLQAGASPHAGGPGRPAIIAAAYLGGDLCGNAILSMRKLVEAGADVNAQEPSGFSALTTAAIYGCPDMVRFLLGAGADPNARTPRGERVLSTLKRYEQIADGGVFTRAGRDTRIASAALIRAAGGVE